MVIKPNEEYSYQYNIIPGVSCINVRQLCLKFVVVFILQSTKKKNKLNSERSEECIDFTMMCVFFFCVSVYSITSRNNAPISNYGDGFRCKSEYPWCIIEVKS
ncbi:Uncharacterized protein FWK35_00031853 [Aphis craccivora]|uniref:Uncharacterized protein n=1 Tax=Aphis craccivora TaxID=307492 RepID=A0A6G0YNI1_APHCR|nr:Uncharacterized protein FWK35_00031853 [Aphis craccivora]